MKRILRIGEGARLSFFIMLGACAEATHALRAECKVTPEPGLYEVVARECENPLHETDFCPLTQYLEIAAGEMYGIPEPGQALAFWYAERRESPDYSYQADVLRGRCLDAGHYLLEKNAQAEASFRLRAGVPAEYTFVGYTDGPHRRLLFRMRLSLRAVLRTQALDRLLRVARE